MLRSIAWYIVFFVTLILSIPAMIKTKILTKNGLEKERDELVYKTTKAWANTLLKIAGVKVTVHGIENIPKDKNVLYIGNHQGNFDIPIYMSQIPGLKGFVSKIEVKKIPGIRTWMTYMYCVFMDRSSIRKSGEAIVEGIKILKNGHSLVIFPEGTRSKGDKMADFKSGSFKLATKSKVPIVPVTMDGSYKIMENNNKKWMVQPAHINLYIHPAIETTNLNKEEQDNLHVKVYEIIKSKLPKV